MNKRIVCKINYYRNKFNYISFKLRNHIKKGEITFSNLQKIYYIDIDKINEINVILKNSKDRTLYYNFKFTSVYRKNCNKIKMNLFNGSFDKNLFNINNHFNCNFRSHIYDLRCLHNNSCYKHDHYSECHDTYHHNHIYDNYCDSHHHHGHHNFDHHDCNSHYYHKHCDHDYDYDCCKYNYYNHDCDDIIYHDNCHYNDHFHDCNYLDDYCY